MMVFSKKYFYISVFLVGLLFIHFYSLNEYLIEFPSWGDELSYLNQLKEINIFSFNFWSYYPFHNMVHSNFLFKTILYISYLFKGVVSHKSMVLIGNGLYMIVFFYLFKIFEKLKLNVIFILSLFFLLFNLQGNRDNFSLIGVLQHSSSILFLIMVIYYTIFKNKIWLGFIIANLGLILISLENLWSILLVILYSFLLNSRHKFIITFLSLGNIFIYWLGIQYSKELLNLESLNFKIDLYGFLSLFSYLGGFLNNYFLGNFLGFGIFMGLIIHFFSIPGRFKEKLLSIQIFPIMVFVSLLLNGFLLTIGRNGGSLEQLFFTFKSVRFSIFHLYALFSGFLAFLLLIKNSKIFGNRFKVFFQPILFIFSALFYLFFFQKNIPVLEFERDRILVDNYNLKNNNQVISYDFGGVLGQEYINNPTIRKPDISKLERLKKVELIEKDQIEFSPDNKLKFFNENNYHFAAISFPKEPNHDHLFVLYNEGNGISSLKFSDEWNQKNQLYLFENLEFKLFLLD